uniref:Ribonuclease A-domain domain-containing protein n=1 Tax=Oreochromis aureus TaxID=47969 RepID=A0A668VYH1_OREAU
FALQLYLILFTCLLLFATESSQYEETRYDQFKRQHVDGKMTEKKCDKVINSKQIYNPDNSCKDTNTFILDNPSEVKKICVEGKFDENLQMTKSHIQFKVVKCELKNEGGRKPNCQYKGNLLTNRYVAVACENNLPVHFAGDIMVLQD